MSDDTAWRAGNALERLSRHVAKLEVIYLFDKQQTDADAAELTDCLLARPDVVTHVHLGWNRLTDETGLKLARYVAASSTVISLNLDNNRLGPATYLTLVAALRVNTSLQYLSLCGNQAMDKSRIDATFVEALRLNPSRPAGSTWWRLYSADNEFPRLYSFAQQLGAPSMLSQLDACDFGHKKNKF